MEGHHRKRHSWEESNLLGKHRSRRSRTRVLLVVGWRHVPLTWDMGAGYSYAEILWMQREPSRLECRSESILQETFKKYPLGSNPREFLIATESEPAAEGHLKEFYWEMILNNFSVAKEKEEGVPSKATIGRVVELAVINLQWSPQCCFRYHAFSLNKMTFNNMIVELVKCGIFSSFE